jgi:ABC-type multidrug transport system ATPase subunit
MKFAAGKTTLMDVIAMRKTSGSITGKIELNGFEQERTSFLRSSGYVEQFDVQQPELTVRETVAFSARLRLDVNNPAIGDDATKMKFVDYVLSTMELTDIQCLQVGSFEEGGKSSIRSFLWQTILAVAECCFAFSSTSSYRVLELKV